MARRLFHGVDRGNLVAHQADGFGFRADEDETGAFNLLGEVGVLGQEAVARVDRHCAGDFRRRDDGRDVQIAFTDGAGPMQTVSSASRTCFRSRSAAE